MMIDTTEFYSLMPVRMNCAFSQGRRVMRKPKLLHSFPLRVMRKPKLLHSFPHKVLNQSRKKKLVFFWDIVMSIHMVLAQREMILLISFGLQLDVINHLNFF